MPSGTGLNHLEEALPDQFYDVGIAEEHAVLFAAGMATSGFHPVCAIYSTFLQRAVDQIIHDVAIQKLPVLFCMDRAGLSPNDGPTHHGLFDISYLRAIPNCILMAPSNEDELADMMATGINYHGPAFIRYPRGSATGASIKNSPELLVIGQSQRLLDAGEIDIWAIGTMVEDAIKLAESLGKLGIQTGVVNARFAKPIDIELLLKSAKISKLIVTMEAHVISGGFGSAILESLQGKGEQIPVEQIGWPDKFIDHGSSVAQLRKANGLEAEQIMTQVLERFRTLQSPSKENVIPAKVI